VLAFRRIVLNSFRNTGPGSISRACSVGGTSEHKEGRAWDWGVSVGSKSDRRAVNRLLDWLFDRDRYGNKHARATRLGIMYLIWNRRIWFPWSGWRTYCVQRGSVCRDPDDGSARHPHTDHVHFSFTWPGAKKRTTYWNRGRTLVSAFAARPDGNGYWLGSGNGSVFAFGSSVFHGDKNDRFLKRPMVAAASTPNGGGYWLANRAGHVFFFGNATKHGRVRTRARISAMASFPTGRGYWLVSERGRVFSFGRADSFGSARVGRARIVALAPTPAGRGYWLVTRSGRVFAFGDAIHHGGLGGQTVKVVDAAATPSGDGYWLVTRGGRVATFGDATFSGDNASADLAAPIVDIAATPSGAGYWLAGAKGRVFSFGDAAGYGSASTGRSGDAGAAGRRIDPSARSLDTP
jgi:hypothetical protein